LSTRKRASLTEIWKHEWTSFAEFTIPFLLDAARTAVVLIVVYAVSWILHLGKAAGLDEGYIRAFEQLHFWVNYAAFGILSLDLLWRIWRAAFKKEEPR
jgi:hypothetical protein